MGGSLTPHLLNKAVIVAANDRELALFWKAKGPLIAYAFLGFFPPFKIAKVRCLWPFKEYSSQMGLSSWRHQDPLCCMPITINAARLFKTFGLTRGLNNSHQWFKHVGRKISSFFHIKSFKEGRVTHHRLWKRQQMLQDFKNKIK